MIRQFAFIAAAALTAVLPAVAHAATGPSVVRSGGTTVIDQRDDQAPLLGTGVSIAAGLDRQTLAQSGIAALTAETILRTPAVIGNAPAQPLEAAIAAHGGALRFAVQTDSVRFYFEALPEDAPAVVSAFQKALAHPDFSGATVRDARRELAGRIGQMEQVPFDVGVAMLNSAVANNANFGLPPLGNATTLAGLLPNDVRAFYTKYYVRGGTVVSAVGRTDVLAAGALNALAQTLQPGQTAAISNALPRLEGSSRSLIAHRDISAPWLLAQYTAPALASKDFGPMLVLTSFVQRTLSDIADVPGVVSPTAAGRSIGAIYNYDRRRGTLTVYVNGGVGSPNRAFATALSLVGVLAATKLQGNIDQFKATALGDFATGATTLESRAWLAELFAENGASGNYLQSAMDAIASTQADDLQRVARKYFGEPTIALVLPRTASMAQP